MEKIPESRNKSDRHANTKGESVMANRDTEVSWGVIGAGDVCRKKSAPAMNKIPRSRMVAVMRRNGAKARARTYRECREMVTACEQAGIPLFVAYYRRMLPNYRKIKELVDNGTIGRIRHVQIRMNKMLRPETDTDPGNWRVDPGQAGGGYFYDLGSHQLDFLDYLLGPVMEARGFSANQAGLYKAEDMVTGSEADLEYGPEMDGLKTLRFRFEMPEHIQQPFIETIVSQLLGDKAEDGRSIRSPSTGVTAARTNRVMEQLCSS